MNKYFYFGLSATSKVAALACAFIVALGWNAKAFSYLIDSELWGTSAGLGVSVSAVLLAFIIPMAYRKKAWVMLSLASIALAGLMFGDAVLSVDAINITDETEKIEAINVENDPAVIAAKDRYELARKAHERAQNILDPNGVANITNRNREREYANQCWSEYQVLRESKLSTANLVRPDRPLTNYAGALLLILAYSVLSLVSDIPMAKYRALAKKDVKAKKVTKVTEETFAPDYKDDNAVIDFINKKLNADELTFEMISDIRRKAGWSQPRATYWRNRLRDRKSNGKNSSKNGVLSMLSANSKNGNANHI